MGLEYTLSHLFLSLSFIPRLFLCLPDGVKTSKGFKITKELEAEMLEKEKNKDIDGLIERLRNLGKETNQTFIEQSYSGDGGGQVAINKGIINNYNITGLAKEKKQKKGIMLSDKACQLLTEIASDPEGQLMAVRVVGGYIVRTNDRNFNPENNNRRETAEIDAAIEELEKLDLIRPTNYERNLFEITDSGFKVADKIEREM